MRVASGDGVDDGCRGARSWLVKGSSKLWPMAGWDGWMGGGMGWSRWGLESEEGELITWRGGETAPTVHILSRHHHHRHHPHLLPYLREVIRAPGAIASTYALRFVVPFSQKL
jgi:hypothetical protein